MDKTSFLKNDYVSLLSTINASTAPLFGKMNVHQMIEHMSYAFRQASGLIPLEPTGDEETTAKMYRFMISDKPFRDNTPNPYLPDDPMEPKHETIEASLQALQQDIDHYFSLFNASPELRILNPFFGNLNHEEWNHLLFKHAMHHLRQFGVTTEAL